MLCLVQHLLDFSRVLGTQALTHLAKGARCLAKFQRPAGKIDADQAHP
ncbi:MAG: hypothetical protein ABI895_04420 [Deltaproteobacteria bacterium]